MSLFKDIIDVFYNPDCKKKAETEAKVAEKITLSNGLVIVRDKNGWVYAEMPNTSDIQVSWAERNLLFEILKELREMKERTK